MVIWILYTECDSEPSFEGYATSKAKAKKWMFNFLKDKDNWGFFYNPTAKLEEDGDGMSIEVSGQHYIQAVKVKKIDSDSE